MAEDKYKTKYKELKRRIRQIEDENDALHIRIYKARKSINRLRLERTFLLERMDKTQHGRDSEHSDGVSDMLSHDGDVNFRYQHHPHHHHHHRGRRGRIPGEKTPRKKKDPNAPKGPGNVFFLFCRLERDKVKDAFPQESLGDVTKLLGQKWKGLTREEKQKYYDMYKKEMDEYEVAMKSYNEATSSTNINANATSSEPVDNEAEAVAAAAEDAAAAALAGAENYSTVSSPMQSSAMPSPELQSDPLLPPEDHDMDEEEEPPAGGLASVDSSLSPQQHQQHQPATSSNHTNNNASMTTTPSTEPQDPSTKQSHEPSPMQQDAGSM
ncbi:hypothetical protein RO3G_14196 [Lichtheimia corymbifera JMRC:FSU:9682]|uniref:HMG box domain-containing protein n=1 Tax=Lichtheimia corymbifera JMRC:FSU:9682 TaxID=1263082 RepID=A0A068SAQ9_9FUNG|nr:hypothetical protein RO3G_14196 [Lichtheimia corymbifera JMRC:FSU:9682]